MSLGLCLGHSQLEAEVQTGEMSLLHLETTPWFSIQKLSNTLRAPVFMVEDTKQWSLPLRL